MEKVVNTFRHLKWKLLLKLWPLQPAFRPLLAPFNFCLYAKFFASLLDLRVKNITTLKYIFSYVDADNTVSTNLSMKFLKKLVHGMTEALGRHFVKKLSKK